MFRFLKLSAQIKWLSRVGGSSTEEVVRSILSRLIGTGLTGQFNFPGKFNISKFKGSKLYSVVLSKHLRVLNCKFTLNLLKTFVFKLTYFYRDRVGASRLQKRN